MKKPPLIEGSLYYENEPRGNFGAEEISEYCQLKAPFIINLGCGLGNEKLAASFLSNACETYIGPNDYIDWTSSGFFAIRFFYELYQNKRSKKEAFEVARGTDSETMLYEWFE